MKRYILIAICLCLMVPALYGCGTSGSASSETTSSASSGASSATGNASVGTKTGKYIDPALEGTWTEDIFDTGYIFNSDGTGTDTFWNLTFKYYSASEDTLVIDYDSDDAGSCEYTYAVSGDQLSMTRNGDDDAETFTYTKQGS